MFTEALVIGSAMVLSVGLLFYLFYPAIVARNSDRQQAAVTPITLKDPQASLTDGRRPLLSLIIPAYNEEDRLLRMLENTYRYLSSPQPDTPSNINSKDRSTLPKALETLLQSQNSAEPRENVVVEWILVNDGSKDRTSQVYSSFIENQKQPENSSCQMLWKLIEFPVNRGKGAAVRAGMLSATAAYCLMVDADGATSFGPGLEAMAPATTAAVVWGSRAPDTADRSVMRWILTAVFHWCVVIFVGTGEIRDTQCGFKLFTREAARELFGSLHLQRWAFDTELLFLANQLEYSMLEVVVPWKEVEGSKLHTSTLNLVLVSLGKQSEGGQLRLEKSNCISIRSNRSLAIIAGMLRDMVCVRLCYTFGLWKIRRKSE